MILIKVFISFIISFFGFKKSGVVAQDSFELMQEVFVNVGRSTGATIISAATGTQFALERGDLNNGVSTYSILELMNRNSTITVSELKKYVNQRVIALTSVMPASTSRNENQVIDWRESYNPRPRRKRAYDLA